MTETLFDIAPPAQVHACTGTGCVVCQVARQSRPEPRPGRARTTDPDTSHAGAASVTYRAGSHKARLLTAYIAAGPDGLTDDEAALACGLDRACFWKRCGELREDGLIEPTGATRLGPIHGEPRMVCRYTGTAAS